MIPVKPLSRACGVRRYTPADGEALAAFDRRMGEPEQLRHHPHYQPPAPDRTAWLLANPLAPPDQPPLWVCERGGALVGRQGAIPFQLEVDGRRYRGSWAVDLMADPAWRLRGVGPALSAAQAASADLVGGIGITEQAVRQYARSGWQDLGEATRHVRVLDAAGFLEQMPPATSRAAAAAAWLAPVYTAVDAVHRAIAGWLCGRAARRHRMDLVPVPAFDTSDANRIWSTVADAYPMIGVRDAPWLRWRFDAGPDAEAYRRFLFLRDGQPAGYAVLRFEQRGRRPVGHIVDFLTRPEWIGLVLHACLEQARQAGAVAVFCMATERRAVRALRLLGFLRRRGARLMVCAQGPEAALGARIAGDPGGWFLTAGDSDYDRVQTLPAAGATTAWVLHRSDDSGGLAPTSALPHGRGREGAA